MQKLLRMLKEGKGMTLRQLERHMWKYAYNDAVTENLHYFQEHNQQRFMRLYSMKILYTTGTIDAKEFAKLQSYLTPLSSEEVSLILYA